MGMGMAGFGVLSKAVLRLAVTAMVFSLLPWTYSIADEEALQRGEQPNSRLRPLPKAEAPVVDRPRFTAPASPDCGANALYFFLQLNSIPITLEEAHDAVPTEGTGASMLDLERAARARGLDVRVVRTTPRGIRSTEMPVIARLVAAGDADSGHYVVLTHFGEGGALVGIDGTTCSIVSFQPASFSKIFSGHALVRENAIHYAGVLEPVLAWICVVEAGVLGFLVFRALLYRGQRGTRS